jgi:plasmid stabilization system protein ParE
VLSVKWKTDALYDLAEIIDYVEQRNTRAAEALHADIVHVAESLINHPFCTVAAV